MNSKPLIGITATPENLSSGLPDDKLAHAYIKAIQTAGGIPIILPSQLSPTDMNLLRSHLDGILLSGGGDIDPDRFHGVHSPTIEGISTERDEMESALVRLSVESNWPLLAICRGVQIVNVAIGGTLYTDIPSQYESSLDHDTPRERGRDFFAHEVTIIEGTVLARILNLPHLMVNSFHHQAVQKVAAGLKVSATADDGLVEGLELPNHPFFVGVQWHPECLPEQPEQRALFETFIRSTCGS
ncbi:MAG: gamma-glutamyl-gamma-aminobutyrate hydrolase family protein [Anaerolineaceae bacterium]